MSLQNGFDLNSGRPNSSNIRDGTDSVSHNQNHSRLSYQSDYPTHVDNRQPGFLMPQTPSTSMYPEGPLDEANTRVGQSRPSAPGLEQREEGKTTFGLLLGDAAEHSSGRTTRNNSVSSQPNNGSRRYTPRLPVATIDMSLPVLRPIPWRTGYQVPHTTNQGRAFTEDAVVRGRIAKPRCVYCSKGNGPFSECVVLDGQFGGGCCSCKYQGRPQLCSLVQPDTSAK